MCPAKPTAACCAALLVAIAALAAGQIPTDEGRGGCGTVLRPEHVALARELHAAALNSPPPATRGGETWIVPLSVHIVRQTDGTGGLPPANWVACLADANQVYADAGVRFVQLLPIRYIDSDDFHTNIYTQEELDALRSTDVVCGTINVYFTPALNVDDMVCGYSSFSWDPVQGIVIANSCTGTAGNRNSEFSHQLGHYFNLYDTHETQFGFECVNGSNCLDAGDLICDTPADPGLEHFFLEDPCQYRNSDHVDPCNGIPYSPHEWNIMSHARPRSCRTSFWGAQYSIAAAHLRNLRLDDWAPSACPCGMLVWVDSAALPSFAGTQLRPFRELSDGLAEVCAGGTIYLRPGAYAEAPLTISQPVILRALGGIARLQ